METIKYSLISKQDLKLGTGTYEITLADGRVVTVEEVDIGKLLEQYPVKSYATTSDLPTTGVAAGSLARVSADSGLYIYSGSAWAAVGGSGSHNHAASEITSGTLLMARGGLGADFSATTQGYLFYFSATGVLSALAPGAVGQFLQTQGAGANPLWANPESLTAHTIGSSTHSDVNLTSVAQGDILYRNGSSQWVNLAPGTSGQYLQTLGASANPAWANVTSGFVIDKVTANTTVTTTTTETNIYSKAIPANTIGTDGMLRLTIRISDLDITANDNLVLRFKLGTTTMCTITITADGCVSTTNATVMLQFLIQGDGATNAQGGMAWIRGTGMDGSATEINTSAGFAHGTAAEDSTGALNMIVTADFSSANAADSITLANAILEKLQ